MSSSCSSTTESSGSAKSKTSTPVSDMVVTSLESWFEVPSSIALSYACSFTLFSVASEFCSISSGSPVNILFSGDCASNSVGASDSTSDTSDSIGVGYVSSVREAGGSASAGG